MPEVNLSTLRDRELRQLLDSARQRGQASLSYMILQEMEARRTNGGREKPGRQPGAQRADGPRIVAVDLGDPLERVDDLSPPSDWDEPVEAQSQAQASHPRAPPPDEPLRMTPTRPPPAPPPQPPPRERTRSRSGWGALLFACGLALGLAGGWKAAEYAYAPRLAKVAAADLLPAPQPATTPAAVPPSAAPPPEAATPEPPPPPEGSDAAPQVAEAAPETPAPAPPTAEPEAKAAAPATDDTDDTPAKTAGGCAAQPTPADRAICGDPKLQRLQRELRQAYADALNAHQDRATLRQRQLAWRDERDPIGDPDRLAQLYQDRIRKLKSATAEALRQN